MEILQHLEAMPIILILLVIGAAISLYRYNKNSKSQINLEDLLIQNGRIDRLAVVLMGGFFLISWTMIYLTLHDKLTEGYLTIYVGSTIGPIIMKILKGESDGNSKNRNKTK